MIHHHSPLSQAAVGAATSIIKHQSPIFCSTITIYAHMLYIIDPYPEYPPSTLRTFLWFHFPVSNTTKTGQSQCCCCGPWPCAARAWEVLEDWGKGTKGRNMKRNQWIDSDSFVIATTKGNGGLTFGFHRWNWISMIGWEYKWIWVQKRETRYYYYNTHCFIKGSPWLNFGGTSPFHLNPRQSPRGTWFCIVLWPASRTKLETQKKQASSFSIPKTLLGNPSNGNVSNVFRNPGSKKISNSMTHCLCFVSSLPFGTSCVGLRVGRIDGLHPVGLHCGLRYQCGRSTKAESEWWSIQYYIVLCHYVRCLCMFMFGMYSYTECRYLQEIFLFLL